MNPAERLLQESEKYIKQAMQAYHEQAWGRAGEFAGMAVDRLHELVPLSPPELQRVRLAQVDELLDFMEDAQRLRHKPPQLEAGRSASGEGAGENPWLVREVPHVTAADVLGMEGLKQELQLFVDKATHPELVARWKGARKGNRMILWGPPGTGKTFFAKYVASSIQAAFYQAKASNLLSKWVGESQKNVARLFETVDQDERAVVFIDELDGVLGRRGSSSTVRDGVVTEFLQCMDGLTTTDRALFFIGATNRPFDLDEAAISRFGTMIYVPLPDYPMRLEFITRMLAELPEGRSPAVVPEALAQRFERHSMRDLQRLKESLADIGIRKSIQGQRAVIEPADIDEAYAKVAPPLSPQEVARYEEMLKCA